MKRTRFSKRARRMLRRALTDKGQLITQLGNTATRVGTKLTLWMGAYGGLGYLYHIIGGLFDKEVGYTLNQALKFPKITGVGLLIPGLIAKFGPTAFSASLEDISQAGGMGDLEEYRQMNMLSHISALSRRVWEPESRLMYTEGQIEAEKGFINQQLSVLRNDLPKFLDERPDLKRFLGADSDRGMNNLVDGMLFSNPIGPDFEKTLAAAIISSMYAFKHPMSRARRTEEIGFDLSMLFHWYDGAPLDRSDTKVRESFSGDADIRAAKKEIKHYGLISLKRLPGSLKQAFLFKYLTRRVSIDAARRVRRLNFDYQTSYFDVQSLFFPGDEDLKALDKLKPIDPSFPSARDALLKNRRDLIRRRFGDDFDDAKAILDDIILPDFEVATNLRMRYDPEYIEFARTRSELGPDQGLIGDLRETGCCSEDLEKYRAFREDRARQLGEYVDYLKTQMQGLFSFENAEALRAIKTAFHLNRWGMRSRFNKSRDGDTFKRDVGRAIAAEEAFSKRLYAVRFHQTVSMEHDKCYERLVRALGEYDVRKD